jgi:hypothetical protein
MIPSRYSFKLLSRVEIKKIRLCLRLAKINFSLSEFKENPQKFEDFEAGSRKRMFLKLAGVVGLGAVASLLLPKKAEALVFGSTPAASVVGIKDSANLSIDPATKGKQDDLLTELKLKADLTETQPVSGVMGVSDSVGTRISPVADDTVVLLRRMVKLMESQATVDGANRQRVTVDAWGVGVLTGVGTSASCLRVAIGSDSNIGTIGSYAAQQMYGDVAHDVYANAIRRNLTFTA